MRARRFGGRRACIHWIWLLLFLAACGSNRGLDGSGDGEEADPPEVMLGERLFLETRFAQSFAAHAGDAVNAADAGDPVTETTVTAGVPLPGPFRGSSINCRACHLVDEQKRTPGGGVRTYNDFARRSPIPARGDGRTVTVRNSPPLVNATLPHDDLLLHFDGEFAGAADLVRGTFTGRNFGWLPQEETQAVAHIVQVIRDDDGRGALARQYGSLPYRVAFAGTSPEIPAPLRIPARFRLEVWGASDDAVLDSVARLVSAYLESLVFARDAGGEFTGSPYDAFLRKNGLPRSPSPGESARAYSRRLREQTDGLEKPRFVDESNGRFALQDQEFRFGPEELRGLGVFLAEPSANATAGVGNCVSCHPAPLFTDFGFHNTGTAQEEYDTVHGAGAFAALDVPGLAARNAAPEHYLPPAPAHPQGLGIFRDVPSADRPGHTDLGVWNVVANPDLPVPQGALQQSLCTQLDLSGSDCSPEKLLPLTIALFKTPGLRDLGQSAPYFHTGRADTIEDVIQHYVTFADLARQGLMRNPDPELAGIRLSPDDQTALAAFLRALNEDYE